VTKEEGRGVERQEAELLAALTRALQDAEMIGERAFLSYANVERGRVPGSNSAVLRLTLMVTDEARDGDPRTPEFYEEEAFAARGAVSGKLETSGLVN
jgi:hypothetical protein